MTKEFTPYEQSLALKELGFDEPCFGYYVDGELRGINLGIKELGGKEPYYQRFGFHVISNLDIDNATKVIIAAPTFSQAFRWFREKYNIQATIEPTKDQHRFELGFNYWIWNTKTAEEWFTEPRDRPAGDYVFDTYEEAELECLKKLIEIVKVK